MAETSVADAETAVVKHGDTFAVLDRHGDIGFGQATEHGIFHDGTRMLSRLGLTLDVRRPLLLSSNVDMHTAVLTTDLTNQQVECAGHAPLLQGTLHIRRTFFLWQGVGYHRLTLTNYGLLAYPLTASVHFGADYADIFEIRGMIRRQRGAQQQPIVDSDSVTLAYMGLDDVTRRTVLRFSPRPDKLTETEARYDMTLDPQDSVQIDLAIVVGPEARSDESFDEACAGGRDAAASVRASAVRIQLSDRQASEWIDRARADLRMLATDTEYGPYPYAGVPWFSTVFGRDGLITAFETLWEAPHTARGVLRYLAAYQATTTDPTRESEPGKILHEVRHGEMANLAEIPFGRYYGTVDATPLFVMLAGAYYRRTADRELVTALWPNILAAIDWIERFGDVDGDGFIEYAQRNASGLVHQGWKDSHDAIFHSDGSEPAGPIALCEVQGYVYAAYVAAAELALMLGDSDRAQIWTSTADHLRERFDEAFWIDELGTYALALDGSKQPCRVRASNAGHGLLTGIVREDRAARLVATLMDSTMFSGWGVRTLATDAARYNPMSYHNGSVWPHDNAIIAAGCARYGFTAEALQIAQAMFDASQFMDLHRLPELFCGFARQPSVGPTLYPVACLPQAWASGAVLLLLRACLGLEIDAVDRLVRFHRPVLPDFLEGCIITGLEVGDAVVDVAVQQHADGVRIRALRRVGDIDIVVTL